MLKAAGRWSALVVVPVLAACGGSGKVAAPATTTVQLTSTTSVSSTAVVTTSTTVRPSATTTAVTAAASRAATAVIAPDSVAGLPVGATKTEAFAALGDPTTTGQDTDLSGARYDFLRWQLDGSKSLTLNFRTPAVTSPRLTDWIVTGRGPATRGGVQVGDAAAKVVAAHGALTPFCCDTQVASVTQAPGRMVVVVLNSTHTVLQIIGGDQSFWSRSIAD